MSAADVLHVALAPMSPFTKFFCYARDVFLIGVGLVFTAFTPPSLADAGFTDYASVA